MEETTQTAPQGAPQETPAPQAAPAPQEAPKETSEVKPGSVGLRFDERTGQRVVETISPKEEEKAPEPEAGEEEKSPSIFAPEKPKEAPKPAPYTADEMLLAMQMGKVDESRIPAEYQPQYQALQAKKAPPKKSDAEIRQEFLDKVTETVKSRTMQEVGITQDELSLGEYSDDPEVQQKVERYKMALELNRRKAIDDVYDKVARQRKAQEAALSFQKDVANWIDTQRKAEPHFNEIGVLMNQAYKTMPYEDAKIIAPAVEAANKGQLTPQTAAVIEKYYEYCRKEYYAKLNGTSTVPTPRTPAVETKGGGKDVTEKQDYATILRNASPRDKARIVSAWMDSMRK